jgi:hypothetical protein
MGRAGKTLTHRCQQIVERAKDELRRVFHRTID